MVLALAYLGLDVYVNDWRFKMASMEKILEIISLTGVVDDMSTFDVNKTFKDNGVDSLDIFTIFLAVQEQLDIQLTEEEFGGVSSVVDLMALLKEK